MKIAAGIVLALGAVMFTALGIYEWTSERSSGVVILAVVLVVGLTWMCASVEDGDEDE